MVARCPDPCSARRRGSPIVDMRDLRALEVTVGVKNGPWRGAGMHYIETRVWEDVGRKTLVSKGSTQESNEV